MSERESPAVWDLSDLYSGVDDPRLAADCAASRQRAQAFEERYRGRIAAAGCTAELLREALDEYEAIGRARSKPMAFASLLFNADTSNPAHGALLQKMQEESTAVSTHLIFFDLEVGRMPEETFQSLIADPALAPYRHYLVHERELAAHHLTEPEEKVLEEVSNTGQRAFTRLFDEVTSRLVFRVKLGDEVKELTQSRALALLYDRERETRRAAAEAVSETLRGESHVLTFIFNTLLQHKATMDRLRLYEYPEQARHQSNELTPEIVQNVVDVCVANYGIVSEYYHLKRRILGLDQLTHYDRYAPIGQSDEKIGWDEGRKMVLDAFGRFTPQMREMAEPFFERRWIDAELRSGKTGGAFCSYVTPDLHPYVLMNYTERPRDVMTLAHELGHALHGVLASHNNFLSFYPSLAVAETASVFGEMLVFEALQERISSPRDRLALLAEKIEDSFATVFRQITMFRFEQAAHRARREEGELPTERYNSLWQSTMQEMFGDSLLLGEEHSCWWLYIPHIYCTPFYVYAYAFGELMVLSLYARYKQEGEPFIQRYLDLLAVGGSKSPQEMLSEVGIDITTREFWQGGVDLIRGMVEQAKVLLAEVEAAEAGGKEAAGAAV